MTKSIFTCFLLVQSLFCLSQLQLQYQNVICFNQQPDINFLYNNWTVPSGVSKIKVELWGGGGGGSASVGGQGGCYTFFTLPVRPGSYLQFAIGKGGKGDNRQGQTGEGSSVTVRESRTAPVFLYRITSSGGAGGGITGSIAGKPYCSSVVNQQNITVDTAVLCTSASGEYGTPTEYTSSVARTDSLVVFERGGNGGASGNGIDRGYGGTGGLSMAILRRSNLGGFGFVSRPTILNAPTVGSIPGGGGAAVVSLDNIAGAPTDLKGSDGGNGQIRVYY